MTPSTRLAVDAHRGEGPLRRLLRRWRRPRPAGSFGDLDPHLLRDLGLEPGPVAGDRLER